LAFVAEEDPDFSEVLTRILIVAKSRLESVARLRIGRKPSWMIVQATGSGFGKRGRKVATRRDPLSSGVSWRSRMH